MAFWFSAALSLPFFNSGALAPAKLELPEGFVAEVYAADVDGARSLALGDDGTVYVGTRAEGKVYALPDRNQDQRVDEVIVLAQGRDTPNGVTLRNGDLYIIEHQRVVRIRDVARHLHDKTEPELVADTLPSEQHHGWRYGRIGPDGALYIGVGAPCNICEPDRNRFALILRMNPDTGKSSIFARGIRNTVGFDWHPQTKEMWFTDNGRDHLGDDLPPDELNHAPHAGMNFGYPYCHGGDLADPEFGSKAPCRKFTAPARKLNAHTAALGMRFYTGQQFPKRYQDGIFIAEHGSWNRSTPIGYRVTFVPFKNGRPIGYEIFADGWRHHGKVRGRPADVLVMPDGTLLVSDDDSGTIYRIFYRGPAAK
jgi:glucose/arabinose dehydrogenase